MPDIAFSDTWIARFRSAYPHAPAKLRHQLTGHPLLDLEAIAALAQRMPAGEIEYNTADLPIGIAQHATPGNGLSVADTIRSIEENGSWMVLKRVERDPVYRDLLHRTLAGLKPAINPVTGQMLQLEGFIFVSSPGAVTPFHCDPEYNILCQLRGSKTMHVFPSDDEEIVSPAFHEEYHSGGERSLSWRDEFQQRAQVIELTAGDAVYVPLMAPHWVKNGAEVSISFSITWRSAWSFRQADAHAFNKRLRRWGMTPVPPRPFPGDNIVKSIAHRAIRKAERIVSPRLRTAAIFP